MEKRTAAGTLIALPVLISACSDAQSRNSKEDTSSRPNIIFIMSDDHDRQAISAYGGQLISTPHIDRIAKEGMLFRNCFVTNSISGPSRAVLLTGKHSHINGFTQNERERFDSSQVTFPKLLKENGYQTAIIGKWHLESEPTGFDFWNILPNQGVYYNPDFINNGKKERVQGYVTDIIMDKSIDWLNHREKDKPFMLMIHNKAPHRNWEPNVPDLDLFDSIDLPVPASLFDDYSGRGRAAHEQEMTLLDYLWPVSDLKMDPAVAERFNIPGWDPKSASGYKNLFARMNEKQRSAFKAHYQHRDSAFMQKNPKGRDMLIWKYQEFIKDYLRCIHSVDENIGRLQHYLDSTGLAKNTIIVYTSDQGFYLGNHGWFDKRFMYEISMHTPFMVYWPGVTDGRECKEIVQNLDWAETLLDIAHVTIPKDMQGISMVPLLRGKKPGIKREALYYHYYEFPVWHHVYPHFGIRTEQYKLICYYTIGEWEFFDLSKDPEEMQSQYQNPTYAKKIESLRKELMNLQVQYRDTAALAYMKKAGF